jgi:hypothetical protein
MNLNARAQRHPPAETATDGAASSQDSANKLFLAKL